MNIYCYNFFIFLSLSLSFFLCRNWNPWCKYSLNLSLTLAQIWMYEFWQNDKICVYALWNLNWYLILTFIVTVAMKVPNVHVMSLIKVKLLDTLSVIYSIKTKYMLIEPNGMKDIYTLALRLMLHITGAQTAQQDLLLFLVFTIMLLL